MNKANTGPVREPSAGEPPPQLPYHPSASRIWDLIHTGVDISFNLEERSASAVSRLNMHPYYYPAGGSYPGCAEYADQIGGGRGQSDLSYA